MYIETTAYSSFYVHGVLLGNCLESTADLFPVSDFPNGFHVVRTNVLVLEVVRVLPNVNSEKGYQRSGGSEWVLVGTSGNTKTLGLRANSQPTPSRSLDRKYTAH